MGRVTPKQADENRQTIKPLSMPVISDQEFQRTKDESVKVYAYANRVLTPAMKELTEPMAGFALFDQNGVLLKLYGSNEYLDWCRACGICRKTRWDSDSIGFSAVSTGLETQSKAETSGEENESPLLKDACIFFAPILVEQSGSQQRYTTLGGLSILSPKDMPVKDSELICSSLTRDIVLHMFMAEQLYELYFQDSKGLLNIDINVVTGKPHVLYHNEELFRILGIPLENLYFKRADTLFDPLPKNEELWDIVRTRRTVVNQMINLSVRGRERTYLLSTEPYQQRHISVCGLRVFLMLPHEISSNVARHIGNNAMFSFDRILGDSPGMQTCVARGESIAHSNSNVMITGESGVGKDVFAQAIHNASRRRNRPFIVLNCAAYPRDLLASELFGYDGGAYTGAKKNGNIGKFELANSGTIFLDEIGDMPLDLQAMLLRVIEQKSFMRIGSNVVRNVDVKIISATNADLRNMVEKRTFRPDLYFRLCTLGLRIPPLRERGSDILLLTSHFIRSISERLQMSEHKILSQETSDLLLRLPWHGNVRELQNVMERVVQLIPHTVITPHDLEQCLDFPISDTLVGAAPPPFSASHSAPFTAGPSLTREALLQALEGSKYNRTVAAEMLGVSRRTFYRKLQEYDIKL